MPDNNTPISAPVQLPVNDFAYPSANSTNSFATSVLAPVQSVSPVQTVPPIVQAPIIQDLSQQKTKDESASLQVDQILSQYKMVDPAAQPQVIVQPVMQAPVGVQNFEPVKIEPVKIEPVKIEPVKIEPVKIEPVKIEPVKIEPVMQFQPVTPVAQPTIVLPEVEKPKIILNAPAPITPSKSKAGHYLYNIEQLLDLVIERNGSDLHLAVGYPAMIRVDGDLVPVSNDVLTPENALELILPVLDEEKKDRLEVNREVDLAYSHRDKARFRINAFHQKQTVAAAFRLIPTKIRSIDDLQLPQIYHQLTKLGQGLVLVTGPTGHGKSTTLAAMIQEINLTRPDHILTIEDPIEYIYPIAKAMVVQREIQDDTHSWEIAMKSALREDPNIVLVGEMRDFETISAAITLAETGHLVFATLHTNSAAQTIDRIIDVFPENQQPQIRLQLSNIVEAVIAQRLIPINGGGRRAVSEIMIANPAIRNLIREAKTYQIDNVIRTSADIGMISLETMLVKLVREGVITMEKAQQYAVRPEEVVRLLKG